MPRDLDGRHMWGYIPLLRLHRLQRAVGVLPGPLPCKELS